MYKIVFSIQEHYFGEIMSDFEKVGFIEDISSLKSLLDYYNNHYFDKYVCIEDIEEVIIEKREALNEKR